MFAGSGKRNQGGRTKEGEQRRINWLDFFALFYFNGLFFLVVMGEKSSVLGDFSQCIRRFQF